MIVNHKLPLLYTYVCSVNWPRGHIENLLPAADKPKLSHLCSLTLSSKIRNSRELARGPAGLKGSASVGVLVLLCKILNRQPFDQHQKLSWILPDLHSFLPTGKRQPGSQGPIGVG